jgi:hypothetical protein
MKGADVKCSVGKSRNTQVLGPVKAWSTSLVFDDMDFPVSCILHPEFTRPSVLFFLVRLVSAR